MHEENVNEFQSHTKLIVSYLKTGASITALEALERFGCMNLKGRIWDIKRLGYIIDRKMVRVPSGKYVAEYRLEMFENKSGNKFCILNDNFKPSKNDVIIKG